jgi:hypothetical protein
LEQKQIYFSNSARSSYLTQASFPTPIPRLSHHALSASGISQVNPVDSERGAGAGSAKTRKEQTACYHRGNAPTTALMDNALIFRRDIT